MGITNDSNVTQTFEIIGFDDGGQIMFTNSATAGRLTVFINHGSDLGSNTGGGETLFFDTSTAGNGNFANNVGEVNGGRGGHTEFFDASTAGYGTFTNEGGGIIGGRGGFTDFFDTSTAGNATLIAKGVSNGFNTAAIHFFGDSTGGTARAEIFDDSRLVISGHNAPGVTIGSIEGTGVVFLGANNLTVGSNNLSTTFSGVIQDGGSFTKIGTGTLTLVGANTYTGGTTVNGGRLVVNNRDGSGTGSGPVQVNAGWLSGRGTIAGSVTVGTGSGSGALLAPGRRGGKPGAPLTIQSTLTFNSDAAYDFGLNTQSAIADKVVASGVTISGARFSLRPRRARNPYARRSL